MGYERDKGLALWPLRIPDNGNYLEFLGFDIGKQRLPGYPLLRAIIITGALGAASP
jgi:hypothetical protein